MKFTRSGSQYSCRKPHQMPPTAVVTRLVLIMVWRKLIRNPNTYASVLGLVWSIIASRYPRKYSLPLLHMFCIAQIYFKASFVYFSLCVIDSQTTILLANRFFINPSLFANIIRTYPSFDVLCFGIMICCKFLPTQQDGTAFCCRCT